MPFDEELLFLRAYHKLRWGFKLLGRRMQLTTPESFVTLGLVCRLHTISEVSEFVSF